jgi:hypothetical protein
MTLMGIAPLLGLRLGRGQFEQLLPKIFMISMQKRSFFDLQQFAFRRPSSYTGPTTLAATIAARSSR